MLKEIFYNKKVQILYNTETEEISFGYFPDKFTPYEHWLLANAFDLVEEEEDE